MGTTVPILLYWPHWYSKGALFRDTIEKCESTGHILSIESYRAGARFGPRHVRVHCMVSPIHDCTSL